MTDKQNNQVTSWFISALALLIAFVALIFKFYIGVYIGMFIIFLTIPLRDRDAEVEYVKEFAENYKFLVYPTFVLIAGYVIFLVYRSIVHRTRVTLSEIFIPFILLLPAMIVYEYKLFKKNA